MNAELHALESAKHDQQIEKLTEQMETLARLIEMDAENIRALARIAEAHEHRLDHIDGGA